MTIRPAFLSLRPTSPAPTVAWATFGSHWPGAEVAAVSAAKAEAPVDAGICEITELKEVATP